MSASVDRRRAGALAVAVATAAALLAVPAATAGADPAPVGIGVARTDDSERGTFRVPVWSDVVGDSISAVTATLVDGGAEVTTVPLVADGPGFWAPAAPLKLTEEGGLLPHLGRYAIKVTAADAQDNSLTRDVAGTLDFTLRPEFRFAGGPGLGLTHPLLDWHHRSTAVTGVLIGIRPGSGTSLPLAARSVSVTRSYGAMPNRPADVTVSTATDEQGSFTTVEFPQTDRASYHAAFAADDGEVHGTATADATPGFDFTQAYVAAKADLTRVEPGHKLTITGTLREGSASGPPLAGAPVGLWLSSYGPGPQVVVTTDANGRFSGSIIAVAAYSTTWSAGPQGPFLTGGSAFGWVTVPNEAAYSGVGITLGPDGWVSAHATLNRLYHPEQGVGASQTTRLEYSPNGRTGWKLLASVSADVQARVGAWGYVDGYYRLVHLTSNELAQAVTTPVHLSRIATRIASNNATPEPIKAGRTITVTGTLQEYRSGWHAMAGQTVHLYFRAKGSRTWKHVASGRSGKAGRVSLRGQAGKDGYWLLQYFGDGKHFDSGATEDYVDVR